jgi:hypothetical protein
MRYGYIAGIAYMRRIVLIVGFLGWVGSLSAAPGYYQDLEKQCKQRQNTEKHFNIGCCMASVKDMEASSFTLAPSTGCDEGYRPNRLKCSESYRWSEPAVEGTGTIQAATPWDKDVGPFYQFVFDPPLRNVHTDQANDQPEKDVVRWPLCGDGQDFKTHIGKKIRISAVPSPSYAETLCLKIVYIDDRPGIK